MASRGTATRRLTSADFVLASGERRFGRLSWLASLLLALALGASAAQWLVPHEQDALTLRPDDGAMRRSLEQARLEARLSQARSRELERQIDTLHQQLREAQEQLLFFRKAQQGKH